MADSQQPNETAAWGALAAHYQQIKDLHLRRLFAEDPGRGERLTAEGAGLYLDYSKNRITDETVRLLLRLARTQRERHLRRCPACAEDVRRMTSTATALAMAVAAEPPPGLKQRVLAAAATTPQLPPLPSAAAARRRHGRRLTRSDWFPRLALGVAAVGVAAAVVLAVVTVSTQDRLDTVQAQNQAIAAVLSAPDAQIATGDQSRPAAARPSCCPTRSRR